MKLDRVIAVRNNKTVYRDGDACLKVFDESYSKADVLNEALNQARVEETGLCIPKVREVTVLDGKWIIVTDYIKGKTLERIMQEDPDNIETYLNRFVDLQLEVQSKSCPLLTKLRDKMNRKIGQTDFAAGYGITSPRPSAARVQPRGCKGRSPLHKKTKNLPLPRRGRALCERGSGGYPSPSGKGGEKAS